MVLLQGEGQVEAKVEEERGEDHVLQSFPRDISESYQAEVLCLWA